MLYYQFQNYDDFKRTFEIVKHNNGVSSRFNKILLAYLKTKAVLHEAVKTGDDSLLDISDMTSLKKYIYKRLEENVDGRPYKVRLININLNSSIYSTDEKEGMCVDGDVSKVRYVRHDGDRERVYKMKAGKFICLLISEHPFGKLLPIQVTNWLSEEFTMDWTSYSSSLLPENRLFVNKEFGRIYDSKACAGDFGSCMTNKGFHTFYENHVDASAAYLESEDEYHHEDDVSRCPECGEWLVNARSYYSELTGEDYCSVDCLEKAEQAYKEKNWNYSDYDEEYCEDEDITFYMRYSLVRGCYEEATIAVETLNRLIEDGTFIELNGVAYDAFDEETRKPFEERKEVLYATA